jgi:hypothetical protein
MAAFGSIRCKMQTRVSNSKFILFSLSSVLFVLLYFFENSSNEKFKDEFSLFL